MGHTMETRGQAHHSRCGGRCELCVQGSPPFPSGGKPGRVGGATPGPQEGLPSEGLLWPAQPQRVGSSGPAQVPRARPKGRRPLAFPPRAPEADPRVPGSRGPGSPSLPKSRGLPRADAVPSAPETKTASQSVPREPRECREEESRVSRGEPVSSVGPDTSRPGEKAGPRCLWREAGAVTFVNVLGPISQPTPDRSARRPTTSLLTPDQP